MYHWQKLFHEYKCFCRLPRRQSRNTFWLIELALSVAMLLPCAHQLLVVTLETFHHLNKLQTVLWTMVRSLIPYMYTIFITAEHTPLG